MDVPIPDFEPVVHAIEFIAIGVGLLLAFYAGLICGGFFFK